MLEKEFDYYLKNKQILIKDYLNKFIVIMDERVVGSYASQEEALKEASKNHKLGTFLIQKVSDNEEDITQRFFSRVSFVNAI